MPNEDPGEAALLKAGALQTAILNSANFSSLWLEVALEGVVLFDPNGTVAKTLRKIRESIAVGNYCRKMMAT